LRERFRKAQDSRALRDLADDLAGDSRAGAQKLAALCLRQLQRVDAEARRVDALFQIRREWAAKGAKLIAGVDEVGVGPLVGPVVAAAVILPEQIDLPRLNDSKKLSAKTREALDEAIRQQAIAYSISEVDAPTIDSLNIYHAALEAMRRAVEGLGVTPDHVLVDAREIPGISISQSALVHGDARDGSIAAASILAKVHRDARMTALAARYPEYGFERNMGYPTAEHRDALERYGALPEHRRSFAPVAAAPVRPAPLI